MSGLQHYYFIFLKTFFKKPNKNLDSVFNYLLSYSDKKCIHLFSFLLNKNVTIKR